MELLKANIKDDEVMSDILDWLNLNNSSILKNEIWEVGITNFESLNEVRRTIFEDIECIHWKCWSMNNFQAAFHYLKALNKSPKVIKSVLNDYRSRGSIIFVYKSKLKRSDYLNHLKGYYGFLKVID